MSNPFNSRSSLFVGLTLLFVLALANNAWDTSPETVPNPRIDGRPVIEVSGPNVTTSAETEEDYSADHDSRINDTNGRGPRR
jgi:hypothetical protein